MNRTLHHLKINLCINALFLESRRFAGHNKWSNIKHTKEEKDVQRAALFHNLKQKMMTAIREGGSAKPSHNAKLAQLIDRAKQVNMPVASIHSFLAKMENAKEKSDCIDMDIRGPGGCLLIVRVSTVHLTKSKMEIKNRLKKFRAAIVDSSGRRLFDQYGHIEAEKDCSLDNAMEDAINVQAEDVEEMQEDKRKYFKFKCKPESINKVLTQLQKLDYQIDSTYETCTPNTLAELSEADFNEAGSLCKRILAIEGVVEIYDNIAR